MQPGSSTVLSRRRFDVDEYYRMAAAGILTREDRVELIDGEVVQMTAVGVRHAACVDALNRGLVLALRDSAWVRVQQPVRLHRYTELEPDVVVARAREGGYADRHPEPEDVLLAIEVAETSLRFDRGTKLPIYADAGIPEVWIVDLTQDAIDVHREPSDAGYSESERITSGRISPAELPDIELEVARILPSSS